MCRVAPLGSALAAVFAMLLGRAARADPEWSTAVIAGVAGVGPKSAWDGTRFYGALHGDALFLRSSRHAVGVGPALDVGTVAFSDARFLGTATLLAPLGEFLAVTVAPGAYVRTSSQGAVGGLAARAFFGVRAYGYTDYALNGGLVVGVDHDLGGPRDHAIVIAAQIDGLVLALPVMLLVTWIRGSSD